MRRADEELADDVVLLEPRSHHSLAAAFLRTVEVGPGALGVSGLGDRDDHVLPGDQILVVDVPVGGDDAGSTVVAELLDDLGELVSHDLSLPLRLGQNVLQVGNGAFEFCQLVDDLLTLEGCEASQLHVEDRLSLDLVDVEQVDQALLGQIHRL